MTTHYEQAIARATELTEELARLIEVLRISEPVGPTAMDDVDLDVLHRLIDGLGSDEEVFGLVNTFGDDLSARVDRWEQAELMGDAPLAKRLLIDLRSTSELLGAVGVASWCRRRAGGDHAPAEELVGIVARTRRALAVWRLTMMTQPEFQ
jgi:hypothetical protein